MEYSDWETYWTKLQTQFASDDAPDVFLMDSAFYMKSFAKKNAVEDLTPFASKLDKSAFYDGLFDVHSLDGKLYAVPRDMNSIILFYNKTLFDQAGLQVPDGTWTWDQALEAAKKLTIDENGKTAGQDGFDPKRIKQYGLFLNNTGVDSVIEPLIWQKGGKLFNDNYTETTIDSPQSKQVLEFMHDLIWKYHVMPTDETTANLGTPFATGKVAMAFDGSWMLSTYNQTQGFEWDVALPPIFDKQAIAVQSVGNSMSTKSKHKEQAWELIEYLSGEEAQKMMASEGASIPALKKIAESDFLQGKPDHKKAFLDAAPFGIEQKNFLAKGEVFDVMLQELKSYFTNIKPLDETVAKIKEESNGKMKAAE